MQYDSVQERYPLKQIKLNVGEEGGWQSTKWKTCESRM